MHAVSSFLDLGRWVDDVTCIPHKEAQACAADSLSCLLYPCTSINPLWLLPPLQWTFELSTLLCNAFRAFVASWWIETYHDSVTTRSPESSPSITPSSAGNPVLNLTLGIPTESLNMINAPSSVCEKQLQLRRKRTSATCKFSGFLWFVHRLSKLSY
jgi:hypothetical protein